MIKNFYIIYDVYNSARRAVKVLFFYFKLNIILILTLQKLIFFEINVL